MATWSGLCEHPRVSRALRYTHVPRPILWLVRGGSRPAVGGPGSTDVESFYLSKFPVTNLQLEAFAPEFRRGELSSGDDDPAVGVSGELAVAYAAWYAEVARKPMRLPTAVEWEHACRGGGDADDVFGDVEVLEHAWCRENVPDGTPIPRLDHRASNGAGLWGMLGGVWEWVDDGDGGLVLCGGSVRSAAVDLSPGARRREPASSAPDDAGFRVAKSLR